MGVLDTMIVCLGSIFRSAVARFPLGIAQFQPRHLGWPAFLNIQLWILIPISYLSIVI